MQILAPWTFQEKVKWSSHSKVYKVSRLHDMGARGLTECCHDVLGSLEAKTLRSQWVRGMGRGMENWRGNIKKII